MSMSNLSFLKNLISLNVMYDINQPFQYYFNKQLNICVPAAALQFLMTFFKFSSFFFFNICLDISVCDRGSSAQRFIVTYALESTFFSSRNYIRILTDQFWFLDSISVMFKSTSWLEREVYDMFGLFFYGNKDLRRMLTDYGFNGFPLQKDYPLVGFVEKQFSLSENIIISRPVVLVQEFRFSD